MKSKEYILAAVGVVLIIISIILHSIIPTKESEMERLTFINDVTNENEEVYIYPDTVTEKIDNFYIVFNKDKSATIKVNEKLAKMIDETDFSKNRYKIIGISKKFTDDEEEKLFNSYNEKYFYSVESQIERDEVESIYGSFYLDASDVVDDWTIGMIEKQTANLFLEAGAILIILDLLFVFINKKR